MPRWSRGSRALDRRNPRPPRRGGGVFRRSRHEGARRRALGLDQRGISILEVLIAAVVLIVVMFGLAQYFFRGRAHIDYEEERRKATAAAQYRLDQLRRVAYDDLGSYDAAETTLTVDGRDYKVTTSIATATPNVNSTTITAQVDWTVDLYTGSGAQVPRSIEVSTVRGRIFQF